jgi:tetratricopeptide (TPR) repeat protein
MRLCREIASDAELFGAVQKLRPDDADLSIARGQILAQAEKWDEAAECFGRVIDRRGLSEDAFQSACLHLLTDRPDAYRQFCTKLIGQAGDVTDPHVAFVLARTCILVPEMTASPEQVVSWAEQAVSAERLPWYLHVLGAACCRAGQYGRAIELLEESTANNWSPAQNALMLAIAHKRQGNSVAAAECLDRARSLMAGVDGLPPPDWLEYHVLVREAEALIEASP